MNKKYLEDLKRITSWESVRRAYEEDELDARIEELRGLLAMANEEHRINVKPLTDEIVRLIRYKSSFTTAVNSELCLPRLECVKCGASGPPIESVQARIDGWVCPECYARLGGSTQ